MNYVQPDIEKLNPNAFQLFRFLNDASVRFIVLYGGSSSGKSYSCAQMFLLHTFADGQNSIVLRKVGASIHKTIYEDFKAAARQMNLLRYFRFQMNCVKCLFNGARIDFSGLDDPEKIKGISNYKRVLMEELSEFDEADFKQIRKRLRGKVGQQIVATFNPISETHWIKKQWLDNEKLEEVPMQFSLPTRSGKKLIPAELCKVKSLRMNKRKEILNPRTGEYDIHEPDIAVIQSTYLNNFWVVGSPDGSYGFYDEQCIADFEHDKVLDPDYYQIYALGEWGVIRSGSEFFNAFNYAKHTNEVKYEENYPIHISLDNNVLPYISCSMWQYVSTNDYQQVRQFDEVLAESPNNTATRAAKMIAKRIKKYGYTGKVYLHGDASTKAANTIDEKKRSWLDLVIETLTKQGVEVVDCVGAKNPPVALSGEFINAIFEGNVAGVSIEIGKNCRASIEDYQSVQKDANGAILKTRVKNKMTGQTYEEHGHLSDTFRYVCADVLAQEFTSFSNRRKRNIYAKDGAVQFFNPDAANRYSQHVYYFNPNINGNFALVHGAKNGAYWCILDIAYIETASTDTMSDIIKAMGDGVFVCECPSTYYQFVRELRKTTGKTIRVSKFDSDVDRRISATSDYVRNFIKFNKAKVDAEPQYGAFVDDMLDYNKNSEKYESASVMSGFSKFVAKLK